jgi:hypothetical protein
MEETLLVPSRTGFMMKRLIILAMTMTCLNQFSATAANATVAAESVNASALSCWPDTAGANALLSPYSINRRWR